MLATEENQARPRNMPSATPELLTIPIPPGPLGVGIQKKGGYCVVSTINETTLRMNGISSPLVVNDVILSLNGIKLHEVKDAPQSWMNLFKAFQTGQRTLVVQRRPAIHQFSVPTITPGTATDVFLVPTVPSPDPLLESILSKNKGRDRTSQGVALKDSTKHNVVVTAKKQKLDGNTPAVATKKPQAWK